MNFYDKVRNCVITFKNKFRKLSTLIFCDERFYVENFL